MDITISYLTLACAPWGQPSKHNVLARARAAAAAGLKSIGVDLSDLPALLEHKQEILSLVSIPECEWVNLGTEDPYYGSLGQFEPLRTLAEEFGVTRVNCGVCDMSTKVWQAARSLTALAEDASGLGMTVAVEPVAFGSVPFLIDVADMLTLAGKPENAGVLVDVWQVTATATGAGSRRTLPASLASPVAEIQLCGFTRAAGWGFREQSQDRYSMSEMLGAGFNLKTWVETFNTGNAPVSYEVPRTDWRQLPVEQVAMLVADDIRRVLG